MFENEILGTKYIYSRKRDISAADVDLCAPLYQRLWTLGIEKKRKIVGLIF